MSSFISPTTDSLANLLGNKDIGFSLKDLMQSRQEASNVPSETKGEFEPSQKGLQSISAMQNYQASYSYSETMSLTLKTQEGDTISVDFRQLYAEYQEYKSEMYAESSPSGVRYFESTEALEATHFEEQFGFSVQGDINDDELAAIFAVFEQVDELANNFFNGNIEQAFKQAVEMDIDFEQLQSVELNLQQTETYAESYQQAAAYENIEQVTKPQENIETAEPSIADLPPYLQQLQSIVEDLEKQFMNAQSILDNFVSSITAAKFPDQGNKPTWLERVQELHQQMFEKINTNNQAITEVNKEDNEDLLDD